MYISNHISDMLNLLMSCLASPAGMLTAQVPIESQFRAMLVDNLNAEIVLGTVTNLKEAMQWLTYTYMYVRMLKNPLVYGLTYQDLAVSRV